MPWHVRIGCLNYYEVTVECIKYALDRDLVGHVQALAPVMEEGVQRLIDAHPSVRGGRAVGLFGCVDLQLPDGGAIQPLAGPPHPAVPAFKAALLEVRASHVARPSPPPPSRLGDGGGGGALRGDARPFGRRRAWRARQGRTMRARERWWRQTRDADGLLRPRMIADAHEPARVVVPPIVAVPMRFSDSSSGYDFVLEPSLLSSAVPPTPSPSRRNRAAAPRSRCPKNGVIGFVRPPLLHCAPPLVITEEELRDGFDRVDRALGVLDCGLGF